MAELVALENHLSRYVGGQNVSEDEDGVPRVLGTGFLARPRDQGCPSLNCLELLSDVRNEQIAEVRKVQRLNLGAKGVFAVVNVGDVLNKIAEVVNGIPKVEIIHDPLEAEPPFPADRSHVLMTNIPTNDEDISTEDELIGDLIAECVQDVYPARP